MVVADVPVGTRLGKYRITGRLGKGGMGIVYVGEDTHLRRAVAIKLLAGKVAHETEVLRRFLLEARAAARLNHPNVVTVHDVGHHGSTYYIVMELVGGGSTQARLQARGALPWSEATRIIADVCRGLAAAHAAGLIHRDVKPANILLAADGTAKLADFGLTKAPALVGDLTQPGTVLGTPQYMSPEHCTGEQLDERTDVYSLGATYYALLVGHAPYDGPDPALILYSHCSAPVPDPRDAVPALPGDCARIIARAMAKARCERFDSADEMLRALLDLLAPPTAIAVPPSWPREPATVFLAPPSTPPEPDLAHSKHRQRIALALGGLGLVLTIGGLGVVLACTWLFLGSGFFEARPTPQARADDKQSFFTQPAPAKGKAEVEVPANAKLRIVLQPRLFPLAGHKGAVKAVSLAGGRLVSAGADGTVRVWALDSGALLHTMHHPAALDAVALSPDGKLVAAGGRMKVVSLWDADSGGGLGTLSGLPANICALAFAPSGKQLAVASDNDLQLCDFEPPAKFPRRAFLLQKQYMVWSVAFARDGKRLAACNGAGTIHVWDLPSLKCMTAPGNLPGRLTAVALSDDGGRVAVGNHEGVIHLWEPDRDTPPTMWSEKAGCITSTAFAPRSGTLVVAGEWAGPLRLCDLTAQKTTRVPAGVAGGVVSGLSFAPDGRMLAAACSDGTVRLWDVTFAERPE